MSSRAEHGPLSSEATAWFTHLSDPLMRSPTPAGPVHASELPLLIEAAFAHGVATIVDRNLQRLSKDGRASALVADDDAQDTVKKASVELSRRAIPLRAQTLLLSHHSSRIEAGLRGHSIPSTVVKGPIFARQLYPQATDRSFTDIDILVDPSSLAASFVVLRRLGFAPASHADGDAGQNAEYKWLLPGNELVLVEVQTDLIHSANLASGVRLRYADVMAAGAGHCEDPAALLLTAAVHGAAGHQFERLQPAVDVLQAARGLAGPIDIERLAATARSTGSTAAVQSALDLVGQLFDEPLARKIADALGTASWRGLRRRLLSPAVALRAQARHAYWDSWRRRAFREIIRRTGRAMIGPHH